MIYALAKMVILGFTVATAKSKIWHSRFSKVNNGMNFGFLVEFLAAIQLDLIMAIFINMRNLWVRPFIVWVSSLLSFIFLVVYIMLSYYQVKYSIELERRKQMNLKLNPEKYMLEKMKAGQTDGKEVDLYEIDDIEDPALKRWGFLKELIRPDASFISGILPDLVFAKDFLVGFFIVSFVEYPLLQMVPSIFLFVSSTVLLFKHKPFKSKSILVAAMLNELTYSIILVIFLIFHFVQSSMSFMQKYNSFGYILIGILVISILINVAIGFVEAYLRLKERCSKKEKKPELNTNPKVNLLAKPRDAKKGSSLVKVGSKIHPTKNGKKMKMAHSRSKVKQPVSQKLQILIS